MHSTFLFPLHACFLALPLEGEAKEHFQKLQDRLREFDGVLKFQSAKTPHLTLQYWPTVMEIEYDQIIALSEKVASSHQPFSLKIEGINTFGNRGIDQVLFLEVPFSEPLARLKKSCPWPSVQPFHPHITLARISHPQKFAVHRKKIFKLLGGISFSMNVDRMRLYTEINGKKQTPIGDFLLEKNH